MNFTPVTLSALRIAPSCSSGKDVILLAAGGQDAELFLALYVYTPRRRRYRHVPKSEELDGSSEQGSGTLPSGDEALADMDIESDSSGEDVKEAEEHASGYSTPSWQHMSSLVGSINNNVLLYLPPPQTDYGSNKDVTKNHVSPRLVVSNNDCTVKFFDVCLSRRGLRRGSSHRLPPPQNPDSRFWRHDFGTRTVCEGEGWGEKGQERIVRYERVGLLRLPVPVNHTSISPDGSTVLSCGDASTVYLYRILPVRDGSSLLFEPLATYTVPVPSPLPPPSAHLNPQSRSHIAVRSGSSRHRDPGGAYLPYAFVNGNWVVAGPHPFYGDVSGGVEIPPACFTTAWSTDGMRFAVASQEGLIRLWDIRSKEAIAGWETGPKCTGEGGAMSADAQRAWFDFSGGAPPWGIRTLKFARNASGRELLVFTEHISRVHVIDADTFLTHDILRIPHVQPSPSGPPIHDDSHLPPWLVPQADQHHSMGRRDLPRWVQTAADENRSQFMALADGGIYDAVDGSGRRYVPSGIGESDFDWDLEDMLLLAREDLRSASQSHGVSAPRRRPRALLPEIREPGGEPSRVLSPNLPFSQSPEPTANRSFADQMSAETEATNRDNSQRNPEFGRYATRHSALAQRANERVRIRERERRELQEAAEERRRRNPLRDDAQMEEDIVYHAALERRTQSEREHILVMRDRLRAIVDLRRERLSRDRSEREQESSSTRDGVSTPYVSRLLEDLRTRSPGSSDRSHRTEEDRDARSGPVLIPRLSSERSEDDVREVLAMHGIPSVRASEDVDTVMDEPREEQTLPIPSLPRAEHRRPVSPSASTVSSAAVSATTSTVAQAGSVLNGEPSNTNREPGSDTHSLLAPSIRSLRAARVAEDDWIQVDGDEMDVGDGDDSEATELDCAEPNVTTSQLPEPGRSASVGPSSLRVNTTTSSPAPSPSTATSTTMSIPNSSSSSSASAVAEPNQSMPSLSSSTSSTTVDVSSSHNHSLPPCRDLIESTDRLDVAGIAFDPRGAYMYVATVDGITEWEVKGTEERWWSTAGCL